VVVPQKSPTLSQTEGIGHPENQIQNQIQHQKLKIESAPEM
jgi:hypothetical protein